MIKISKITNFQKTKVIGVDIEIEGEHHFISTDQKKWHNIRVGTFPHMYELQTCSMASFPHEIVLEVDLGNWEDVVRDCDEWTSDDN